MSGTPPFKIEHQLNSPAIAYGCMNLGGKWNHENYTIEDLRRAEENILTAFSSGIRLFDHADIYTFGKSEKIFGEILKHNPSLRKDMIIQTKCGIILENKTTSYHYDSSYDYIIKSALKSIKNLHIDCIDVFLIHRIDPLTHPEEVAKALDYLVSQNLVKHVGVSNYPVSGIKLLQNYCNQNIMVNQIQLSLFQHHELSQSIFGKPGDNIIDYCMNNDIVTQAWSPLGAGITEKINENQILSELLDELTVKYEHTKDNLLLAWLLNLPGVRQVIIGTMNAGRIKNQVLSQEIKLSKEDWYKMLAAVSDQPLP